MRLLKMQEIIYKNILGTFWILFGMVLYMFLAIPVLADEAPAAQQEKPKIQIIPGDGMNLAIEEELNPHYVIVKLNSPVHNWFSGNFTNLPTDKEVTIGLSMNGNDTSGNKADVTKWKGLLPVFSYGSPDAYETYEWFQKDAEGRWVSGDPFKKGDARYAGTGTTPEQSVIPKEVADEFLSEDGTYWQAWREVDKAEAVPGINVFRIMQKFAYPTATVSMRVPYLPNISNMILEKIELNHFPGVTVHKLGKSQELRDLSIVHFTSPDPKVKSGDRPVILLYGNEDGNEPDSSWVMQGAISWLLSNDIKALELREKVDFLIVPLFDPDGAANCTYGKLTNLFTQQKVDDVAPTEVMAYTKFVMKWVISGKRLDVVCAYHNVECSETKNVLCPVIDIRRAKKMNELNNLMLKSLTNVLVSTDTWFTGFIDNRFNGWCNKHWGSIVIAYEVNSRYPDNRLSQQQLEQLGGQFSIGFYNYVTSELYQTNLFIKISDIRKQQIKLRREYWRNKNDFEKNSTPYEILTLGY